MKSHRIRLACILLLGSLLPLVLEPPPCAGAEMQMMPVSELRSGMTGYGVTALGDGPPQKFQVEVLGVLKGQFPKGDIILTRLSGPVIDETGSFFGMSGSPIYIDDKLIGAVAYGWGFCQIPLAGVTPAAEMLQVQRIDRRAAAERKTAARAAAREALRRRATQMGKLLAARPADLEPDTHLRQAILQMAVPHAFSSEGRAFMQRTLPSAVSSLLPQGVSPEMRPLPIPMAVSGMGRDSSPLLPLLQGGALMPVQGLVAAGEPDTEQELQLRPGMPVGGVFISGDMNLTAMGTLTWTDGESVLAFGHPMLGSGDVDIPLAVGRVHTIVPSVNFSFRLTSTGKTIGRITQDRESGILGKLGEEAPMFPCKVRVRGAVDEDYSYRIAAYWETAPFFAFMAVAASSTRWEGIGNPYTLSAKAEITVSGRDEPVVLQNAYSGYSVLPPSMELVEMPMAMLLLNPYREVQIEGLNYELEVRPGLESASIESIWADRTKAEPGSWVTVFVRLRQYRGEEVIKKVLLRVPKTAKPGSRAEILVCDAMTSRMIDRRLDPGFFQPQSFEGLVDTLERMESNKNLVVRASFVEQGVRYAGQAMPALPQSALSILQYNPSVGRTVPLIRDVRQAVETPWVLTGSRLASITIKEAKPHKP